MTATLLLLLKAAVGLIIFAIGLDSTARRRDVPAAPAGPAAALAAGDVRAGAAGGAGAGRPAGPGAGRGARPAGAGGVGRRAAAAAQAAAHRRRRLHLQPGAAVVAAGRSSSCRPGWRCSARTSARRWNWASTDVAWVLAKSFLLPLAVGMLLRRLAPDFAARWASRLIGAAGVVLTASALAAAGAALGGAAGRAASAACWP